jgi:hypothetical protein
VSTIPASAIVSVTPNVLSAGGSALDMNGLLLTTSIRVPIGTVASFASANDAADYFGLSSDEADAASTYFNGFENSNVKPGAILFAQYPQNAVPAYLRGGDASTLTLAELQALNGTLSLTVDGSEQTGSVNLSSAQSFSAAAALIEVALNTQTGVTGSIAANVVVGRIDPNVGTASIAGTTMTVSAITTGAYAPGQTASGVGIASGTTIVSQLTGTAGSTGTYQVSISQTVASTTVTGSGGCLTVATVTTGTLAVGQKLSGSGVTSNTTITNFLTGVGGTGKYAVDLSQTVAPSTTITATGGTLTVTVVSTGSLGLGDVLVGAGITSGNEITAFLTGVGGTGTYLVSVGDTFASGSITVAGADVLVTFDSVSGAFIVTSGTDGANSTITAMTGTLATPLFLTIATGAVLSQGADAASPAAFMSGVAAVTQNWATFMTVFDPDVSGNDNKLAFADWTNDQNDRYAYICWDTDGSPSVTVPATTSLGYLLQQGEYSGTFLFGHDGDNTVDFNYAAFVCGTAASIDFEETDGRITFAFRRQSGLVATCSNETAANNLIANGYNFYGAYATANDDFIFLYDGAISGPFLWADSYINQIWLNNALQLALMVLLINVKSIPYNSDGYALMQAACLDPINAGLNFGAFRSGVTLSAAQAAEVNSAAGVKISDTLTQRGWYLQIKDASPQVRQARGTPPCTFWYMDGQSVQKINLTSVNVQ